MPNRDASRTYNMRTCAAENRKFHFPQHTQYSQYENLKLRHPNDAVSNFVEPNNVKT
jgi:hypothetical protein